MKSMGLRHTAHAYATHLFRLAITATALCAGAAVVLHAPTAEARASCPLSDTISEKDLPKQGRDTLALVRAGGPFPHDRDGITFQNRERVLPKQPRGFYKEYTVRTPGVRTRGARRIVCGGDQRAADNCFYSADHYKTFACIAR